MFIHWPHGVQYDISAGILWKLLWLLDLLGEKIKTLQIVLQQLLKVIGSKQEA